MNRLKLSSPPGYRIRTGETIVAIVYSNAAVAIAGAYRVLYDDGEDADFRLDTFTTGSARAAQLVQCSRIAARDGFVVEGWIGTTTGGIQRGQTFAQVIVSELGGAGTKAQLSQGYIFTGMTQPLGQFTEPGPAGGAGAITIAGSADPAANAEVADQTVPAGAIWLLRVFTVQLVQGLTQTPLPSLEFEAVNLQVAVIPAMPTALGASTTAQLTWGIGLVQTSFTAVAGDEIYIAPLPVMYLASNNAADRFATLTDGIGANTNYGAATYIIEEWVMPN